MAILILKDGKRYQERCPNCSGLHLYDQKTRGSVADTERYLCPDCGHRAVAPILELLIETASPSLVIEEDG
jgi:predicted RNA-binding Zn-ribbon protein involved in translation (DUF1610 family)